MFISTLKLDKYFEDILASFFHFENKPHLFFISEGICYSVQN